MDPSLDVAGRPGVDLLSEEFRASLNCQITVLCGREELFSSENDGLERSQVVNLRLPICVTVFRDAVACPAQVEVHVVAGRQHELDLLKVLVRGCAPNLQLVRLVFPVEAVQPAFATLFQVGLERLFGVPCRRREVFEVFLGADVVVEEELFALASHVSLRADVGLHELGVVLDRLVDVALDGPGEFEVFALQV